MLQRLYINNYRCFENFDFHINKAPSTLLIGKNGSGKSTFSQVLRIFQAIGRGINRTSQLVKSKDFFLGHTAIPMRFELQAVLDGKVFQYILALELPENFKEVRILEEKLQMDSQIIYSRHLAQVTLQESRNFGIDWHLVALPVIQLPSNNLSYEALNQFREWLAHIVVLAPTPRLMKGEASDESLKPEEDASNLADWLSGVLAHYPAGYTWIDKYLQKVLPDLQSFRFERNGRDSKILLVRFQANNSQFEIEFNSLSDGEKCFFLCATLLAANENYGPLLTFWDEPDNYLSLSEVSHFIVALRSAFNQRGQIIMTSHNAQSISRFSNENTWLLSRKSHLEPSVIRSLEGIAPNSNLIQAIICNELEA